MPASLVEVGRFGKETIIKRLGQGTGLEINQIKKKRPKRKKAERGKRKEINK